MSVKAKFQDFTLSSTYLGDKAAPFSNENYNNHRITVTGPTGEKCSFEFWASIIHPEIETQQQVIEAFQCFVSDATSGLQDFEEFCSEFGYDTDSRSAERTHKACQRAAAKLSRVYSGDVYDLANALNEWESAHTG